jgi:hypothetical protein
MAWSPISYPDSVGLFSICTRQSVGAHLEQLNARFAANLACLAIVRASLSWFGTHVLLQRLTTWADVETGLLGLFGVSASSKAPW